ncbi:MAG: F0F1 ATP synthase subunit delta [Pseudomonadota bacterium]
MELDWSTFFLEIFNFLVLVWILRHFFYVPVLTAIEQRRKSIADSLAQAETQRAEAAEMEKKYRARLDEWEEEKQRARDVMHKEINEERERLLQGLKTTLENERRKERVLAERRLAEERRKPQEQALAQAAAFAGKLLRRLAGPELDHRLYRLLMEDLPNLPRDCCETLRAVYSEKQLPARVTTARALGPRERDDLQRVLVELAGRTIECAFVEDPALISGLRINIGPLVLQANLRDELHFFAESIHGQS